MYNLLFQLYKEEFENKINLTKFFYREEYEDTNNLGILHGIELINNTKSAFVYYWSKGFIHYAAIDSSLENYELVPDKMIEFNQENKKDKLIEVLKEITPFFK